MTDSEQLTKIYDLTFEAGELDADLSAVDKVHRIINQRNRAQRDHGKLCELSLRPKETLLEYVARLDVVEDRHLGGCHDCNYDKECMECSADGDGAAHNCNCEHGPGYGYQLRKTLQIARLALKAGAR